MANNFKYLCVLSNGSLSLRCVSLVCFPSEVKYGKTTTVRYFKHDDTFVDIECTAGLHQGCRLDLQLLALSCTLAMIMSQHQQVQVYAYIDNVTLTATVRATYAAFNDLQKTIKEDITLWLNDKECCIYTAVQCQPYRAILPLVHLVRLM